MAKEVSDPSCISGWTPWGNKERSGINCPLMSASAAEIAKQARTLLQEGKHAEALDLLQKAAGMPGGAESLFVWTSIGQCALALSRRGVAIDAFINAARLQPDEPKIWKSLADLYEVECQWDRHVDALRALSDIAKAKNNLERVVVLSTAMVDSYVKAKSYSPGLAFISEHLADASIPKSPQHVLKMVGAMDALYVAQQSVHVAPSLSAKASLADQSNAAFLTTLLAGNVLDLVVAAAKSVETIDAGVVNIMHVLIQASRAAAMREQGMWARHLALCVQLINAHAAFASSDDMLSHAIEAWFISGTNELPADELRALENAVKKQASLAPSSAHLAIVALEGGMVADSRPFVSSCISSWIAEARHQQSSSPDAKRGAADALLSTKSNVTSIALCALVVGCALDGFRGLSMRDLLHATQEAKRKIARLSEVCGGVRRGWETLVSVAHLCSMARVSGKDAVINEATRLPSRRGLFVVDPSQPSSLCVNVSALLEEELVATKMLTIQFLGSIGDYVEATRVIDAISPSNPEMLSWLLSEKAHNSILSAATQAVAEKNSHGLCVPPTDRLLRSIELGEAAVAPALRSLQGALKAGDTLAPQIEAQVRYRLSVGMWLAGGRLRTDKAGCIATLLASAKLDPGQPAVYTFIGHYYSAVAKDIDRAEKCYIKALGLDPHDAEAGVALSDLYLSSDDTQGGERKAVKLWEDVAQLSSHAQWCFAVHGQYRLVQRAYEAAVDLLQMALELDPSDSNSWHGLGVCYANLGQHGAAYKALQRAYNFANKDVAVISALGVTCRKLGLHHEALCWFEKALDLEPNDELSLKGGADIYLAITHERLAWGWSAGAAESMFRGIQYLERIIGVGPINDASTSYKSIWKLLGDLSCLVRFVGPADVSQNPSTRFQEPEVGSANAALPGYDKLLQVIRRGTCAYRKAVEYKEDLPTGEELANAWFDLGCSLYFEVCVILLSRGLGSGLRASAQLHDDVTRALMRDAVAAFCEGLKNDPTKSQCLVGVGLCLPSEDVEARRSCFIRAIQIDSNPSAYANLGLFYLESGNDTVAQACFGEQQLIEANPLTWVCLGSIYERQWTGDDSSRQSAVFARDAYVAALEVSKPAEALLGSALAWLKVHGILTAEDRIVAASSVSLDLVSVRYEVEVRVAAYLRRRPIHPLAWEVLAWAQEVRGAFPQAQRSLHLGLLALNQIATDEGKFNPRVGAAAASLLQSYRRCQTKAALRKHHGECDQKPFPEENTGELGFESLRTLHSIYPGWLDRAVADSSSSASSVSLLTAALDAASRRDADAAQVIALIKEALHLALSEYVAAKPSSLSSAAACFQLCRFLHTCPLFRREVSTLVRDLVSELLQHEISPRKASLCDLLGRDARLARWCCFALLHSLDPSHKTVGQELLATSISWHPQEAEMWIALGECGGRERSSVEDCAVNAFRLAALKLKGTHELSTVDATDSEQAASQYIPASSSLEYIPRCYARSAALLSSVFLEDGRFFEKENRLRVRSMLLKAVRLDPTCSQAWAALAAITHFDAALEDADAHTVVMRILRSLIDSTQLPHLSDSASLSNRFDTADGYYYRGEYEKAVDAYKAGAEAASGDSALVAAYAHRLGLAYAALRQPERAEVCYKHAAAAAGAEFSVLYQVLTALAHLRAGEGASAARESLEGAEGSFAAVRAVRALTLRALGKEDKYATNMNAAVDAWPSLRISSLGIVFNKDATNGQ